MERNLLLRYIMATIIGNKINFTSENWYDLAQVVRKGKELQQYYIIRRENGFILAAQRLLMLF